MRWIPRENPGSAKGQQVCGPFRGRGLTIICKKVKGELLSTMMLVLPEFMYTVWEEIYHNDKDLARTGAVARQTDSKVELCRRMNAICSVARGGNLEMGSYRQQWYLPQESLHTCTVLVKAAVVMAEWIWGHKQLLPFYSAKRSTGAFAILLHRAVWLVLYCCWVSWRGSWVIDSQLEQA